MVTAGGGSRRGGSSTRGRLLPGEGEPKDVPEGVVQAWLAEQITQCAKESANKSRLKIELMKRRALARKLAQDGHSTEETEQLKEQLKYRNEQIMELQVAIGHRDIQKKLLSKLSKASHVEELRAVMAASLEQQIHLKSDNTQLEAAARAAEEKASQAQKCGPFRAAPLPLPPHNESTLGSNNADEYCRSIQVAESGFERRILEAQQEYEENMAGLLEAIAKQDAIILQGQAAYEKAASESATVLASTASAEQMEQEQQKLRTMYKSVTTAHESSEREVKRLKRMVQRAEKSLQDLREENTELEAGACGDEQRKPAD